MKPVVLLENVSRRFAGAIAVDAISSCNLRLDEKDFMTIMGPSGSGKSTLLNILGLLDRPTDGSYHLLGHDVANLSESSRSALRGRHIGFVFQSFQLLEYRVSVENVMMSSLYQGASTAAAYEAAMEALKAVNMESKANVLPIKLSGGERQRIAIARAIAGSPALLLADEPTGNLDSRNAESVLELFAELNRAGTTVALITHDSTVAALGNRRLAIRDGVVTEAALR